MLDLTSEIEVFHMPFEECHTKNINRSIKGISNTSISGVKSSCTSLYRMTMVGNFKLGKIPCFYECSIVGSRDDTPFIINCSYQYGPDTYLLQVKDATFPARLREYLNVARTTSADFQDCKVRKRKAIAKRGQCHQRRRL